MNIHQEAKGSGNTQVAIENFNQNADKLSSLLAQVLPSIAAIVFGEEVAVNDTVPYEIDDKIEYNNVKSYKEIIAAYGMYGVKIDELYNEYNNARPGFRKRVLSYFSTKYRLAKETVCSLAPDTDPLIAVRASADKIIRTVFEKFKFDLMNSKDLNISMEEVETCALAVVCHAFIECKILEKPSSGN